jgi:hypothetical protein
MTAEEIRKWHSAFERQDVTAEVARARARIEIAAQLAEMNEHLAKIANPLIVVDQEAGDECAFCDRPATILTRTCEGHRPQ